MLPVVVLGHFTNLPLEPLQLFASAKLPTEAMNVRTASAERRRDIKRVTSKEELIICTAGQGAKVPGPADPTNDGRDPIVSLRPEGL
jgi:hypothetical protein